MVVEVLETKINSLAWGFCQQAIQALNQLPEQYPHRGPLYNTARRWSGITIEYSCGVFPPASIATDRRFVMSGFEHGSLATRMSLLVRVFACVQGVAVCVPFAAGQDKPKRDVEEVSKSGKLELATFGAGCFWCTEALLERVKGVEKVVSGYSGALWKTPPIDEL